VRSKNLLFREEEISDSLTYYLVLGVKMLRAYFIIALLFCALVSTLLFGIGNAQPSVPDFTVKLVSHPYNVATVTSVDPYTGAVKTYPGYVEENKSIEVTIKNQPFGSYQMPDGNWSRLYYNLRFKGHYYTGDWTYYPLSPESGYINASNSDFTVISLPKYLSPYDLSPASYPVGSEFDFQVQALTGYDEAKYAEGADYHIIFVGYNFTGATSDWSITQTLTIGENQTPTPSPATTSTPTTSPELTPTPTSTPYQELQQTEQEAIIGAIITAVVIGAGLGFLIYLIKRK
jgi:hypothetical protein